MRRASSLCGAWDGGQRGAWWWVRGVVRRHRGSEAGSAARGAGSSSAGAGAEGSRPVRGSFVSRCSPRAPADEWHMDVDMQRPCAIGVRRGRRLAARARRPRAPGAEGSRPVRGSFATRCSPRAPADEWHMDVAMQRRCAIDPPQAPADDPGRSAPPDRPATPGARGRPVRSAPPDRPATPGARGRPRAQRTTTPLSLPRCRRTTPRTAPRRRAGRHERQHHGRRAPRTPHATATGTTNAARATPPHAAPCAPNRAQPAPTPAPPPRSPQRRSQARRRSRRPASSTARRRGPTERR